MYETLEERAALFDFTGKYTELDLLNKRATGFGWAVLVSDNFEGKRPKVVKLPNSESATRELLVEAEILTKIALHLRHPNLVELKSVDKYVIQWQGKKEDRWFLVLQYGGTNLRSRLGRLHCRGQEYQYVDGAALPLEEMLKIAIQLADGLRALHDFEEAPGQHIIHRDVKPENILIDEHGLARLTDFGISKVVERLSQSVTAAGTLPYLAPEYSRGRLHACSDIYSLGIVLYEMATGAFPFRTHQDRFYEMPKAPHLVRPELPAALSDAIQRCLWWSPSAERGQEEAQRYQSAGELLDDLRRAYSRLYPVPPRFRKDTSAGSATGLYKDTETGKNVRVFIYSTNQPAQCVTRLARLPQNLPQVLSVQNTFQADGAVGVVVALPPEFKEKREPLDLSDGRAVEERIKHVVRLARELEQLHRAGVYHGFLGPQTVLTDGKCWWIDRAWLGQLAGLASIHEIVAESGDLAGYLAPEVLAWESLPTLSADLYGLGALLLGMLTGKPPQDPLKTKEIAGSESTHYFRTHTGLRETSKHLSRRLEAILVKALHPNPVERHHSLEELIADLEACQWPRDMVLTLIEDARDAQKQNRLIEAYDALDEALRLEPGNPEAHHARAEVFFLEGEPKWALKENQKALDVNPAADVWFLHGQCLLALAQYDEAERHIRRGLEREDCSRGRHLLARCLEKSGRPERAVEEYEQAARLAEVIEHNRHTGDAIRSDLTTLLKRMKG